MTAYYLPKNGLLNRMFSTNTKNSQTSRTSTALRYLLQDKKFDAEYLNDYDVWRMGQYNIYLYDSPQKVTVHKDIPLSGKGQVNFTGGVLYQAESGRTAKTLEAGETVWVIARYGNTLLVVDQQSALFTKALL